MSEVLARIGGIDYRGWEEFDLTWGLETVAQSFNLKTTLDIVGGARIETAQPVELFIDSVPVLSGFTDGKDFDDDETTDETTLKGRSKTGDLVDSSAIHSPGEWNNKPIAPIVKEILKPYGISLVDNLNDSEKFKKFRIQQGETSFEAIERACRMRAALAYPDGSGSLIISRFDKVVDPANRLVYGEHFRKFAGGIDAESRHSEYIVKSQTAGDDSLFGVAAATPEATAKDPGMKRYRPLIVIAEAPAENGGLEKRANWEARTRNHRSNQFKITAPGFFVGGDLWRPGSFQRIIHKKRGIDKTFIVSMVRYIKGLDGGESTEATITLPGAFSFLPLPESTAAEGLFG